LLFHLDVYIEKYLQYASPGFSEQIAMICLVQAIIIANRNSVITNIFTYFSRQQYVI
jgi:hypothetical protein